MTQNLPSDAAKRLLWPLRLTHAGMVAEAALRAFWPALSVLLLAGAVLASGVLTFMRTGGAFAVLGLVGAALLLALVKGAIAFHWPSKQAANDRLDATLPGQPIAALLDNQEIGTSDTASRTVWLAHSQRMLSGLKDARAPAADMRLASRDPYALRYMALLAFLIALGFGGIFRVASLSDLLPQPTQAASAEASWEGWITPPAYTGKPSLYLNDQPPGVLPLPQGSHLTLKFYGRLGALTLHETVSDRPLASSDPQASYAFDVTQDGDLIVSGKNGAEWQVQAIPDTAPTVQVTAEMTRTLAGDLQQGFSASDDYGVASGQAFLALDLAGVPRVHGLLADPEPRAEILIDLPIPFRGDRTGFDEVLFENFAAHPWAGLPVTLTMTVTDEAGQAATSRPTNLILPGRRFLDPLAMALIEQRRDLFWTRDNAPRIARLLRAVSHRPDGFFSREVTYLKIRVLVRRLEAGHRFGLSDTIRDEIAEGLWDIAISIEDGNLTDARERLQRAQDRLSEAMEQGASDEELAELMDDLRQAMRDFTQQMARQQGQDGQQQSAENTEGMQEVTQAELDAVMDEIEDLMKQGRQDEAQAMLDALQELMENMQVAEGQPGQDGDNPGGQAMQGLADSLSEQQGLSDEAFRDLQEQQGSGAMAGESDGNVGRDGGKGQGQSHSGEGGSGQGDGAEGDLSERQQALADDLNSQRRNLPGAGSEGGDAARDALEQAEDAMRGAAEGLENGDLPEAMDRQAEAMEALREGMRQLDNAMAEAERNREGQQGSTDGQPGSARQNDPLGRGPNARGSVASDAPLEGGEDVYRRAEELMQDIRRRSGEGTRPQTERDYLRRLLDRF